MEAEKIKKYYDEKIKNSRDYEKRRWFKNKIQAAGYNMTLRQIRKFVSSITFLNCLEVGPGSGIWTKELLELNPQAQYDLVDISGEMLKLAKESFKNFTNLRYFENDILKFTSDRQYDFFFSVRAFEYFSDKELAIKKISELLIPGGCGFVITKTPKYWRKKFLGIEVPEMHRGQIAPAKLRALLIKYGFSNIEIYPVTLSLPVINFAKVNVWLFKLLSGHKLNFLSQFFCESYCVKFKKL